MSIKRLRAELAALRDGLNAVVVPMKDGTTRYFDEMRVYGEVMAAVRSGDESSPVYDLLRGVDYDALASADEGGYVNFLALAYSFAFDESGEPREVADLSDNEANNPPTPSTEGSAFEAELDAEYAKRERIKNAPLNDLTPAERRKRFVRNRR
jgi:hypothetical protein